MITHQVTFSPLSYSPLPKYYKKAQIIIAGSFYLYFMTKNGLSVVLPFRMESFSAGCFPGGFPSGMTLGRVPELLKTVSTGISTSTSNTGDVLAF
jgi:hypothetical protein